MTICKEQNLGSKVWVLWHTGTFSPACRSGAHAPVCHPVMVKPQDSCPWQSTLLPWAGRRPQAAPSPTSKAGGREVQPAWGACMKPSVDGAMQSHAWGRSAALAPAAAQERQAAAQQARSGTQWPHLLPRGSKGSTQVGRHLSARGGVSVNGSPRPLLCPCVRPKCAQVRPGAQLRCCAPLRLRAKRAGFIQYPNHQYPQVPPIARQLDKTRVPLRCTYLLACLYGAATAYIAAATLPHSQSALRVIVMACSR